MDTGQPADGQLVRVRWGSGSNLEEMDAASSPPFSILAMGAPGLMGMPAQVCHGSPPRVARGEAGRLEILASPQAPGRATLEQVVPQVQQSLPAGVQLVQVDASDDVWGELERLLHGADERTPPASPGLASAREASPGGPPLLRLGGAGSPRGGEDVQATLLGGSFGDSSFLAQLVAEGKNSLGSDGSVLSLTLEKTDSGEAAFSLSSLAGSESAQAAAQGKPDSGDVKPYAGKGVGKRRGFIIMDLESSPDRQERRQSLAHAPPLDFLPARTDTPVSAVDENDAAFKLNFNDAPVTPDGMSGSASWTECTGAGDSSMDDKASVASNASTAAVGEHGAGLAVASEPVQQLSPAAPVASQEKMAAAAVAAAAAVGISVPGAGATGTSSAKAAAAGDTQIGVAASLQHRPPLPPPPAAGASGGGTASGLAPAAAGVGAPSVAAAAPLGGAGGAGGAETGKAHQHVPPTSPAAALVTAAPACASAPGSAVPVQIMAPAQAAPTTPSAHLRSADAQSLGTVAPAHWAALSPEAPSAERVAGAPVLSPALSCDGSTSLKTDSRRRKHFSVMDIDVRACVFRGFSVWGLGWMRRREQFSVLDIDVRACVCRVCKGFKFWGLGCMRRRKHFSVMDIDVRACVSLCMCMYVYTCMCALESHRHRCRYVCVYTCMYTCTCVCVHVHMYAHLYIRLPSCSLSPSPSLSRYTGTGTRPRHRRQ